MVILVKRRGQEERFDERKVYASVYTACMSAHYKENECEKVANNVCKSLKRSIKGKKRVNSSSIKKAVLQELKKIDKEVAWYYDEMIPNLKEL